jgi:beta-galactosidase/beta-glucuronidase
VCAYIPNDGNFCVDGLNFPDRIPHTGLIEYKKIIEPVFIEVIDLTVGRVRIRNRYSFITLDHLQGIWQVLRDDELLQQGEFPLHDIHAGTSREIELPYKTPVMRTGATYWLNISFVLKDDCLWAKHGHEVAWAQFEIPVLELPAPPIIVGRLPELKIRKNGHQSLIRGEDFSYSFNHINGTFIEWEYAGKNLLTSGPQLSTWRAPIDNDVHIATDWRKAGLDRLQTRIQEVEISQIEPQIVRLVVKAIHAPVSLPPVFSTHFIYTIYGSGDILFEAQVNPSSPLPDLPRMGIELKIPAEFDRFTWYGRGPHENYIDRKESARIGVYSGTVNEQYVPYVFPQENGNKSDVRWATLTDLRGSGILVIGRPLLNVSALYYTSEDLDKARHTYELSSHNFISLHLDHAHGGLGSNSCGPRPLEKYLLEAKEFIFSMRFRPFHRNAISPMTIYRTTSI